MPEQEVKKAKGPVCRYGVYEMVDSRRVVGFRYPKMLLEIDTYSSRAEAEKKLAEILTVQAGRKFFCILETFRGQ